MHKSPPLVLKYTGNEYQQLYNIGISRNPVGAVVPIQKGYRA